MVCSSLSSALLPVAAWTKSTMNMMQHLDSYGNRFLRNNCHSKPCITLRTLKMLEKITLKKMIRSYTNANPFTGVQLTLVYIFLDQIFVRISCFVWFYEKNIKQLSINRQSSAKNSCCSFELHTTTTQYGSGRVDIYVSCRVCLCVRVVPATVSHTRGFGFESPSRQARSRLPSLIGR